MNDRQSAFKILNKIEKDKAYTNLALDSYLRTNPRGLLIIVCYGAGLRRYGANYYP